MLECPDGKATQNVDKQDEDASYRITSDKLRGAIHRAIKIRFPRNALAALERLVLSNQTCVEIRVDRHLLAGHRIERKSGGYL